MKKKSKIVSPISIRLTPETVKSLNKLMLDWGENRSRAISRCIDQVSFKKDFKID